MNVYLVTYFTGNCKERHVQCFYTEEEVYDYAYTVLKNIEATNIRIYISHLLEINCECS